MERLLRVRITRTEWKAVYVLTYLVLAQLAFRLIPASDLATSLIDVGQLCSIWFATRVFRGGGEAVAPARPWWKATAWPIASWRLGALFAFGFVLNPIVQVLALLGVDVGRFTILTPLELVESMLFFGLLAAFYLNSWTRLRATHPPPKAPREPKVLVRPSS